MSAPLRLTAEQLRDLAAALTELSKVRRGYGVSIGDRSGIAAVSIDDADVSLELSWDEVNDAYYVDDRSGS